MEDQHKLIKVRQDKIEGLRELGVEPYPFRYDPTHTALEVVEDVETLSASERTVCLAGRLASIRTAGKTTFADLADSTGRVQLYLRKDELGDELWKVIKLLDIGDIVGVTGFMFTTRMGQITVHVQTITVLCKTIRALPVVKIAEDEGGETRTFDDFTENKELKYRQRSVDLALHPDVRSVFLKRATIVSTVRRVLEERGFVEVETPALQTVYGGAAAKPFRTHHNALDIDLYLRISPELYLKQLIVGGMDRVYDLNKNFRNEGMDRTHNPEFTMMECYQAYADYTDMMELTETIYSEAAKAVVGSTVITFQGSEIDLTPPWPRMKMVDAIAQYGGGDVDAASDDDLRRSLADLGIEVEGLTRGAMIEELFENLAEEKLTGPVFITHHPKESTPLCKESLEFPGYIERFEPYIAGWEVGNAYSELNDPVRQRELLEEQASGRELDGEVPPVDQPFLEAIEYGMPPSGGLGLGIDRMVMLLTDQASIRDVILFPTMRPEG